MKNITSLLAAALCGVAGTVAALDINYANKGADGAFAPSGASYVVDLSRATTGAWDSSPGTNAGNGIYDPEKWAVVFKFSEINIPGGTTVTFKNHPSRAPVVWLVESNVTIVGVVGLYGDSGDGDGNATKLSEPGPGGFRGGDGRTSAGALGGGGYGPGGSDPYGVSDSAAAGAFLGFYNVGYRPPTYGNERILPLIGGSGSGGALDNDSWGGGAGGGALLLAASGTVAMNGSGTIHCGGGGAARYGSGGACRIIADRVEGSGLVYAVSGQGSHGRIRIETTFLDSQIRTAPETSLASPTPVVLWPETNQPTARVVSVSGLSAPLDPRAGMFQTVPPDVTLSYGSRTNVVIVETTYLPTNATVVTRVVPRHGLSFTLTNELDSVVSPTVLRWRSVAVIAPGYHALQVRATAP